MRGRAGLQLLRCLGLVSGLFCMLAGCGGNSGSNDTHAPASRVRQLSLQLVVSPHNVNTSSHDRRTLAQGRQVQPGDPGFIERLEVRLQAQGGDLVPLQVFTLNEEKQEMVMLDVAVPDTVPVTFQVLVSSFNHQGIELFRGSTLVARGQDSAVVTLARSAPLLPVPATSANLQNTIFQFQDGTVFGLASVPVTLVTGTFVGNVGDFAFVATGFVASGQVMIGSCTFQVTASTFPPGQGPQVNARITIDPCQIDALDKNLIATNVAISSTPTVSSLPVPAPPENGLNLPSPPPNAVLDEDTSVTIQVTASLSGNRPGTILFSIPTAPAPTAPAHGMAMITSAGVLTYRPVANFSGSDRLVVTVVVLFSDNNAPPLLLGTVPISIAVRPVNDPPAVATPGHQPTLEGTAVSLPIMAQDLDSDQFSFSVTTPPAHGTATVTPSGLATYLPILGFTGPDSFTVTVTDNGTPPQASTVSIAVTVINRPPVPTAPAISTLQNTAGRSQISAKDPDVGQTPSFSVTTPPAHGTATVTPNGLATYLPTLGFTGPDSFTVTVTDNGTLPQAGSVLIVVAVKPLFGTDASSGTLLTIDPATGAGTIVGPLGIGFTPALAIDPTTGIMYTATGGSNSSLYRVDPATGVTTLIGSTGLGFVTVGDIAFRADGTLYAAVDSVGDGGIGSDTLAIIDKTTGKATGIGPFGVCTQSLCIIEGIEAIAFDAAGTLWGALSARSTSSLPGLYKIDPTTGTATFFAPILDATGVPPSGGVVSLQFCGGTLFGGTAKALATPDDGGRLITINPATGLFTFVGTVSATGGGSLDALACQ